LKGGDKLAGYKKVTKEDAEVFLKLYEKYLLMKLDDMKNILKTLPTNVIERCFNGVEFFDKGFDVSKLDEVTFGVGGLHGYSKIVDVSNELNIYKKCDNEGKLDEIMQRYGFKVNRKKIGVLG
jgi:hypothetical protein